MKSFLMTFITLVSSSSFAGAGGKFIMCTDNTEREVQIEHGASNTAMQVTGFKEQGANIQLKGNQLVGSILKTADNKSITAFVSDGKGRLLQIISNNVSGSYKDQVVLKNVTVSVTSDYEQLTKHGFECLMMDSN